VIPLEIAWELLRLRQAYYDAEPGLPTARADELYKEFCDEMADQLAEEVIRLSEAQP
jgi:hypothetical protein